MTKVCLCICSANKLKIHDKIYGRFVSSLHRQGCMYHKHLKVFWVAHTMVKLLIDYKSRYLNSNLYGMRIFAVGVFNAENRLSNPQGKT